jgi:hypothetical protein
LTKIKQCDVELSNVLQAFQVRALFLLFVPIALHIYPQAELLLDVRVSLIVVKPEVKGTPILFRMHLTDNRDRLAPIPAQVKHYREPFAVFATQDVIAC